MAVRKIEYVLGLQRPHVGHSLGVLALDSSPIQLAPHSKGTLFSGGCDGRINAWAMSDGETSAVTAVDIHANWVNDLKVYNNIVYSCSSDTTVKQWNPRSGDVAMVGNHKDYVKCLCTPGNEYSWIASGGLDGRIIGWDLETSQPQFDLSLESSGPHASCSLYALDTHAGIICSGGPDPPIRFWDPREKECVATLVGHTDTVRRLAMKGNRLLSCSADATVRLWDLRALKALRTFNHADSVWSLCPESEDLEVFYAGDRLGNVTRTDARANTKFNVCKAAKGVTRIVNTGTHLWTATNSLGDLNKYALSRADPVDAPPPAVETLKGHRAIIKSRVLNNKRHVLIVDSTGELFLVDLLRGIALPKTNLPRVNCNAALSDQLDDIVEGINTMDVLDNWCTVTVKAGQLSITMDPLSFGNTEIYVDELENELPNIFSNFDEEKKVNLGDWMLSNLFSKFLAVKLKNYGPFTATDNQEKMLPKPVKEKEPAETAPAAEDASRKSRFKIGKLNLFRKKAAKAASPDPSTQAENGDTPTTPNAAAKQAPELFSQVLEDVFQNHKAVAGQFGKIELPDDTKLVVSEIVDNAGAPTVIYHASLGSSGEPEQVALLERLLPGWVGEALLLHKIPQRTPVKVGFELKPLDDATPTIVDAKSRFVALPVLRARKIKSHVLIALKQKGLCAQDYEDTRNISIFCNGVEVDPRMTLSTIRTRIWRNGGDVVLCYKIDKSLLGTGLNGGLLSASN